jgi:protein-L-isoaspartate(D-aspartate) O-methyltransferase
MDDSPLYQDMRCRMVREQIERRGISNPRVLEAMRTIPRHYFVKPERVDCAYEDYPLPTSHGQTISQPYIVAIMSQLLHLKGDEIVLEVGTGSGYQAAILGCLARQVHTIEYFSDLAEAAQDRLTHLGLNNITVHSGDGSGGLPEFAPYDGILVTAAAPRMPEPLIAQLKEGGRLVIPEGERYGQELILYKKCPDCVEKKYILPVAFVPLRGNYGWPV